MTERPLFGAPILWEGGAGSKYKKSRDGKTKRPFFGT